MPPTVIGNGLLLAWDSTAAAAIVACKPLLKHHTAQTLSAVTMTIAAVSLLTVVPLVTTSSSWSLSSTAQWAVLYCGAYNTLSACGDAWAVTQIPASVVASWLVLEPIFTAILSAILLGG